MRANNFYRVSPFMYTKFGSTDAKLVIGVKFLFNDDSVVVASPSDNFSERYYYKLHIQFIGENEIIVDTVQHDIATLTFIFGNLPNVNTEQEKLDKVNDLYKYLVFGTYQEKVNVMQELLSLLSINVLPLEEQWRPYVYPPYINDEEQYID